MGGASLQVVDGERVLETERLALEPLHRGHAEGLFGALGDPRVYRYLPQDPPPSVAVLAERYAALESRRSPSGHEVWLNWAVRERGSGELMGFVQSTVRAGGSALLAYEFGPRYWGRGFAVESCSRVVSFLFGAYGLKELEAEVDTRNAPSQKLLERLGFRRVDFRAGADFFKGSPSDEFRYRLTRDGIEPRPAQPPH